MTQPPLPPRPLDYAVLARRWRVGRVVGWSVLVVFALLVALFTARSTAPNYNSIPFSSFYHEVERDSVTRLILDGDEIAGQFARPTIINGRMVFNFRTTMPAGAGANWAFVQWLMQHSQTTVIEVEPSNNPLTNFVLPFIPWLVVLFFIGLFVFRRLRHPRQPIPVIIVSQEGR